jgi:iron complex outermembrane receptor protein
MTWASASALAIVAAVGWSGSAAAQTQNEGESTVEEVVVTGSLFRGTPEDSALPVDVIGAEELSRQGNPSTVELIKALPASQGVLGDSNQFDGRSQGSEGIGTVNLRGLGAARTLVLFNGKRLAPSGFLYGAIDTNLLPTGAVGRVEVLKDGAAATYGSEAIGGVVNFISPTNFEGLQVNADYNLIDGSKGDWGAGVKWGWVGDRADVFVAFNYAHRSKLEFTDRSFTNEPFAANPDGGWSIINQPIFVDLASGAAAVRFDTGCTRLGGTLTAAGCQYHFSLNDNLVEPEDRYSVYGQVNFDINETTKFHADAMYSRTNVTMNTTSGYALLAGPSSTFSPIPGRYYVPRTNPGLIDYAAKNPAQFPNGNAGAALIYYRPFAFDGNPLFGGKGAAEGKRDYEMFRISADVTGELPFGGIGYNGALTYSQNVSYGSQYDTEISRFQLALSGLGGPNCNYQTGTPGVGGCQYFNPFSNSAPSSPIFGTTNSQFTSTSPVNSEELASWFFRENWREYVSRLFVAELVFNGKLPGVELPGGEIGWAVGGQYRRNILNIDLSDGWNDKINPCPDSPITGSRSCLQRVGPLAFLGTFNEQDIEQDVWATFGELQIPVTDDFNIQLAARYEDYGGNVGGTFDPKVSARWQMTPAIALRGAGGTTFRAPPGQMLEGRVTPLAAIGGSFRPVDVFGNPNLDSESATTWSAGAAFRVGGLRATIDYWSFDFKDPLVSEPLEAIVSTMFPGNSSVNCGNPAYAALQARFEFTGACAVTNVSRVRTQFINGSNQKTSGIDLLADYDFPNPVVGGDVTVGGSLTYVLDYKVSELLVEGLPVQPAYDAVGFLNQGQSVVPVPEWKGQFYTDYSNGPHNLRVTVNYISSYIDQRASPFVPLASLGGARLMRGQKIAETVMVDLSYRVFLPWDTTVNVRVANVFDEDPSFARLAPGYDPFTGNPMGRTVKFSVAKKF